MSGEKKKWVSQSSFSTLEYAEYLRDILRGFDFDVEIIITDETHRLCGFFDEKQGIQVNDYTNGFVRGVLCEREMKKRHAKQPDENEKGTFSEELKKL